MISFLLINEVADCMRLPHIVHPVLSINSIALRQQELHRPFE
jgi:hypothetical protein